MTDSNRGQLPLADPIKVVFRGPITIVCSFFNSFLKKSPYAQIKSHLVSEQRIWIDDVTGKVLSPPKIVPEHNLMFTDGRSMFYLYIPESSGHAILLEPTGMADASWVGMRFGKCRIKQ